MPSTVQPVFLPDWGWQVICSHLLSREACSRRAFTAPAGGTTTHATGSAFAGPQIVISCAVLVPARSSAGRSDGPIGKEAIMGAAELASGEQAAGAL
jgi:hypothetical protein